jgi:hypothetical protein
MSNQLPEPWLRGPIAGSDPMFAPFIYAMMQVHEDVTKWTEGLSTGQLWAEPLGLGPAGFHMRHIGGSTSRLASYLRGEPLTEDQMRDIKAEKQPGASRDELLSRMEEQLRYAQSIVLALDPRSWNAPRKVGRKALPTTVGGLVTHMAEHAQRHTGELIVTTKVVRATSV